MIVTACCQHAAGADRALFKCKGQVSTQTQVTRVARRAPNAVMLRWNLSLIHVDVPLFACARMRDRAPPRASGQFGKFPDRT